jgi:hypothetical protein
MKLQDEDKDDDEDDEEEICEYDLDKKDSIKASDNEKSKTIESSVSILQNNQVSLSTITLKNINNEELDAVVSNSAIDNKTSIEGNIVKDEINNLDTPKSNCNNNENSNASSSQNNVNSSNDYFSDSSASDEDQDREETESDEDEDFTNNVGRRKKRTNAHKSSNIGKFWYKIFWFLINSIFDDFNKFQLF